MADLHTGTHTSQNDGSMTAFIELAMQEEWLAARGEALPADGPGAIDRRVLFAAVAKGVLRYLHAHRQDLLTSPMVDDGTGLNHRHEADFGLEDS
jgi:hypothetical protein